MEQKKHGKAMTRDDPWSGMGGGEVNEKTRSKGLGTTYGDDLPAPSYDVSHPNESEEGDAGSFNPLRCKSHLWHALEGLDRYPNYLSRWNEECHMDLLEQALESQLSKVRQQRHQVHAYKTFLRNIVRDVDAMDDGSSPFHNLIKPPSSWKALQDRKILHPRLLRAMWKSKQFRSSSPPEFQSVMEGRAPIALDVSQLTDVMDEELPDVYSLPVLHHEFGELLCDWIEEVSSRAQQKLSTQTTPLQSATVRASFGDYDNYLISMSYRPFDLSDIGLDWLVKLLFYLVVRPVSAHLFRDDNDELTKEHGLSSTSDCASPVLSSLDWVHGFVAGYAPDPTPSRPRQHLVMHTDDSEVTLNVCIGRKGFTGGVLSFGGMRGRAWKRGGASSSGEYEPEPGRAVLHAGRHLHSVSPVTCGSRFALVLWARSWKGTRATTCPCCWLNNRRSKDQHQTCICGPRWN
jgi:hypothetical protein